MLQVDTVSTVVDSVTLVANNEEGVRLLFGTFVVIVSALIVFVWRKSSTSATMTGGSSSGGTTNDTPRDDRHER